MENQWHRYDVWPPKSGFKTVREYLQPEKLLTDVAPNGDYSVKARRTWLTLLTRFRTGTAGAVDLWRGLGVADVAGGRPAVRQRPKRCRELLLEAGGDCTVTVTGDVSVDLFAATTGTDTDWVVKLIDVYPADAPESVATTDVSPSDKVPGGYELMVAEEIFRGRYRNSFTGRSR